MASGDVLNAQDNAELLSYIINVTPELREDIQLPKQGESIIPIGKLIVNNQRYRNAFINTVNLIGLTVIKRNGWDNPWDFTKRGELRYGQQVREIILDLCNVYDYNGNFDDKDRFLSTVVPNVFNYMHELNYQKFYQTTTSEAQLSMAFESETGLFDFIDTAIGMLYESMAYDTYIVDKYMLCRRILDGTVTPTYLSGFSGMTARQKVSALKSVSNKFTFRSPNYNPAGVRKATSFADQILIVNTEFEAEFSTEVLATSFFKDEADMKARLVLIDGFDNHDTGRLLEVLGDAYSDFTDTELAALAEIPAVLISREWFMDYDYAVDTMAGGGKTEFFNPTTLENNHFLHVWKVFSTSPFENASVFGLTQPSITSVTVSPDSANVTAGTEIQLGATVVAAGFANKAVRWYVDESSDEGVTVDQFGHVKIASTVDAGDELVIGVESVYDDTKYDTCTLTVIEPEEV